MTVDLCPVCREPLWTGAYIMREGVPIHSHCARTEALDEARATLRAWAAGQRCGCCGKRTD